MLPQMAQKNKNLKKLFAVKHNFGKSERLTFLTFKKIEALCTL